MNNVKGMTIKEFNDVLNTMHGIYPFKPETTYLGDFKDVIFDSLRQVEIVTTDEETGIKIIMAKSVERGEH